MYGRNAVSYWSWFVPLCWNVSFKGIDVSKEGSIWRYLFFCWCSFNIVNFLWGCLAHSGKMSRCLTFLCWYLDAKDILVVWWEVCTFLKSNMIGCEISHMRRRNMVALSCIESLCLLITLAIVNSIWIANVYPLVSKSFLKFSNLFCLFKWQIGAFLYTSFLWFLRLKAKHKCISC